MARHPVRGSHFAAITLALIVQGCDKPSPVSAEGESSPTTAARGAHDPSTASSSDALHGRAASISPTVARVPREQQHEPEQLPPWLAELFHDPDPHVRIEALDAWARERSASLDPVTYALVDPDESVRARAQALLEEELAQR